MSDQQTLFIKMAMNAWENNQQKITAAFNRLSDEELETTIAPGRNRVVYLLGHLTAVNDMMLPILGFGARQYPQLDEAFIRNPDGAVKELPAIAELRAWWTSTNERLADHFKKLTPAEWFQRHTVMSDEDFEKEPWRNKLSVLINRTNHLAYHLGQLVLVLK